MKIKNISYYITLIFASSISFYLAKITLYSPIYLIYTTIAPICIIYIIYRQKTLSLSWDIIISLILLIYTLFLVIFIHTDSLFSGASINLFLGLLAYIFIRLAKKNIRQGHYNVIINMMIYITLILTTGDTIYRLLNPSFDVTTPYLESKWFYYYKVNTVMFADSNTTGLILIILYFFIIQLEKFNTLNINVKKIKYIKMLLIILLIVSFSRAAHTAFILGSLYEKYHIQNKNYFIIFLKYAMIPIVFAIAFLIFSYLYITDLSFQSKFEIINIAINVYKEFSLYNKIFGIGFLKWEDVLGIYTHNIFITYIIQTGSIGLFLFILFIISTFRKAKYIWIPIIIVSLSFFSYLGTPFLFVPLAIICNIYDDFMVKKRYTMSIIYNIPYHK
jgi:hypothetical protein